VPFVGIRPLDTLKLQLRKTRTAGIARQGVESRRGRTWAISHVEKETRPAAWHLGARSARRSGKRPGSDPGVEKPVPSQRHLVTLRIPTLTQWQEVIDRRSREIRKAKSVAGQWKTLSGVRTSFMHVVVS
jgi:hypothetical protein